jgi:hypothetical protein
MLRARRHRRACSAAAFALVVLLAEVAGRSLTGRVDRLLHVRDPLSGSASYYPFLLLAVKAAAALLVAHLLWRFARAYATAAAARRLLGTRTAPSAPRMRLRLSPPLAAGVFAATSVLYLVQADAESGSVTLAPWLHTYALSVFAVLAVLAAVAWSVVSRWLADYERYAAETVRRASRLAVAVAPAAARARGEAQPPRARFGLAFESRPPPAGR